MNDITTYAVPTHLDENVIENFMKNFLSKNKYVSDEKIGQTYYRKKHPWLSGQGAIEYSIENGFIYISMYLGSPIRPRPFEKNEITNIHFKKFLAQLFDELRQVCVDADASVWDALATQLENDPYHTKGSRKKWYERLAIICFVFSIILFFLNFWVLTFTLMDWFLLTCLSYGGLTTKKRPFSIAAIAIASVSLLITFIKLFFLYKSLR